MGWGRVEWGGVGWGVERGRHVWRGGTFLTINNPTDGAPQNGHFGETPLVGACYCTIRGSYERFWPKTIVL